MTKVQACAVDRGVPYLDRRGGGHGPGMEGFRMGQGEASWLLSRKALHHGPFFSELWSCLFFPSSPQLVVPHTHHYWMLISTARPTHHLLGIHSTLKPRLFTAHQPWKPLQRASKRLVSDANVTLPQQSQPTESHHHMPFRLISQAPPMPVNTKVIILTAASTAKTSCSSPRYLFPPSCSTTRIRKASYSNLLASSVADESGKSAQGKKRKDS